MHIYHSALPFTPSSSFIRKHYAKELENEVQTIHGLPQSWVHNSRTIATDDLFITSSRFSHNDKMLLVVAFSGIILFEVASGACLNRFPRIPSSRGVTYGEGASFSPDDCLVAIWSQFGERVQLWDIQSGSQLSEYHEAGICDVTILADGTLLSLTSWCTSNSSQSNSNLDNWHLYWSSLNEVDRAEGQVSNARYEANHAAEIVKDAEEKARNIVEDIEEANERAERRWVHAKQLERMP